MLFIKKVPCFICGILFYFVCWKSKMDTQLLRKLHFLQSFMQVYTIPREIPLIKITHLRISKVFFCEKLKWLSTLKFGKAPPN